MLYLSTDGTISTVDFYAQGGLDVYGVPALAAGATCTVTRTVQLPTKPPAGFVAGGSYYFGTMIDTGNAVAELNEGNNQNVGVGADLDQVKINAAAPDIRVFVRTGKRWVERQDGQKTALDFGAIRRGSSKVCGLPCSERRAGADVARADKRKQGAGGG